MKEGWKRDRDERREACQSPIGLAFCAQRLRQERATYRLPEKPTPVLFNHGNLVSLNNRYFSSGLGEGVLFYFFYLRFNNVSLVGCAKLVFSPNKHMFLSPFLRFLFRKSHRGQDNRSKWKQVTFPCLTHSPWTRCLKIRSCRRSLILQSGPRLRIWWIYIRNRGAFSLFTLSADWLADVCSELAASSYTWKPCASWQISADVCD